MTTPAQANETPPGASPQVGRRRLVTIIPASATLEGGGFEVYRPFPGPDADWFDPFLLLDEIAPHHLQPGEAVGAPDHPHRGFETVTYVLQGEVEHRDSAGNHGLIGPGDAQWMTAGDGVVHAEMPSKRLQTEGGVSHGLQLWINLPAALRRTTPRYQAITADRLATTSGPGWTAIVLAGSILGVEGPAAAHTPMAYARVTVQPGATVRIPAPDGHTALVYAFDGCGQVGDTATSLESQHLAVFGRSSGDLILSVDADEDGPLDAIVLTGEPIGEPMVRYGPFVMNTTAELEEAVVDYQAGRMGSIPATGRA